MIGPLAGRDRAFPCFLVELFRLDEQRLPFFSGKRTTLITFGYAVPAPPLRHAIVAVPLVLSGPIVQGP